MKTFNRAMTCSMLRLIDPFLDRFAETGGRERRTPDARARDLLLKYDFPGNIRELENILEWAVVNITFPALIIVSAKPE